MECAYPDCGNQFTAHRYIIVLAKLAGKYVELPVSTYLCDAHVEGSAGDISELEDLD